MLTKLKKNQHGVAAVEFALILPALVALLFGSVGTFDFFRADRAVSHAANTVVDLVARQETMDDATRDSVFATGRALLAGYATDATYAISIASIALDADDNLIVEWSEANANSSPITDGELSGLSLPDIPMSESIIFVRLENNYAPIFGTGLEFNRETVRRPRFVAKIAYDNG